MQVKGKKEAIRVYEPLALRVEADESLLRYAQQYAQARENYLAQRWVEAREQFIALLQEAEGFRTLCGIYLQRIVRYEKETLPDDWCGIWQHDSK